MKKIIALLLSLVAASCQPAFASQNATVLPTVSPYPGLTMLGNINQAFNTLQSNFSGSSAPSTCVNNQFWVDSTNHLLKFTPDCTNWYALGNYNGGWTAASSGFQQLAVTSTGSANAYVVTYSPAPTALVTGQHYYFIANFANTGAATANINGTGAKSLKKQTGVALASGDISIGQAVDAVYDGTNLQVVSGLSAAGALTLANGTVATTQTAGDNSTKVATTAFTFGGVLNEYTVFKTAGSATWTPATGTSSAFVKVVGGGGGGGGSGSSAQTPGGTGGTSNLGTIASATGGNGGPTTVGAQGALGGVGSLGQLNLTGSAGGGCPTTSADITTTGGFGAVGLDGFGSGVGGVQSADGGAGGANTGAGGGGGGGHPSAGVVPGAGGGEGGSSQAFMTGITGTYAVNVGAGGTAGAAGVSGQNGGVGGTGVVIIYGYR